MTNSQGHSPADLARIKRNSDIARIIEQKQNDVSGVLCFGNIIACRLNKRVLCDDDIIVMSGRALHGNVSQDSQHVV